MPCSELKLHSVNITPLLSVTLNQYSIKKGKERKTTVHESKAVCAHAPVHWYRHHSYMSNTVSDDVHRTKPQ